jgi:hypothetical protein
MRTLRVKEFRSLLAILWLTFALGPAGVLLGPGGFGEAENSLRPSSGLAPRRWLWLSAVISSTFEVTGQWEHFRAEPRGGK